MFDLPTGTVTFLLTDVEGSTALWEAAPEAMRAALARHDALFEQAVTERRGVHIRPRGEGDSRFAVFSSAVDAILAALAFQQRLADEAWPTPRPITVRIGVHTGHAEVRDGDYYGTAVNRCARIRDLGHGGETLLSDATVAVARDDLPRDAALRDRGVRRLEGLSRPERLFQVLERQEDCELVDGVIVSRWRRRWRASGRRRWPLLVSSLLLALGLGTLSMVLAWSPRPQAILLADNFDRTEGRQLPELSDFPNAYVVGYSGGEYSVQAFPQNRDPDPYRDAVPSAIVPGWYFDAALSIYARLLGDPEHQSIVIGCRNNAPGSGYWLTIRPAQGTGSLDRADGVAVPIRLAPLTNVTAILRGTAQNHIELSCMGSAITASINGTRVAAVRDTTYSAGRMWIGGNVNAGARVFGHVLFDNLLVRGYPAPAVTEHDPAIPANLEGDRN